MKPCCFCKTLGVFLLLVFHLSCECRNTESHRIQRGDVFALQAHYIYPPGMLNKFKKGHAFIYFMYFSRSVSLVARMKMEYCLFLHTL